MREPPSLYKRGMFARGVSRLAACELALSETSGVSLTDFRSLIVIVPRHMALETRCVLDIFQSLWLLLCLDFLRHRFVLLSCRDTGCDARR